MEYCTTIGADVSDRTTKMYFPTANGKDSSEVGKMRMFEGMKKPRAGELQGA